MNQRIVNQKLCLISCRPSENGIETETDAIPTASCCRRLRGSIHRERPVGLLSEGASTGAAGGVGRRRRRLVVHACRLGAVRVEPSSDPDAQIQHLHVLGHRRSLPDTRKPRRIGEAEAVGLRVGRRSRCSLIAWLVLSHCVCAFFPVSFSVSLVA